MGTKKSGKIHKNREKNLQFFGVKQSKIQWTDLKIKLMKHKNLNWQVQNQKSQHIKFEKIITIAN